MRAAHIGAVTATVLVVAEGGIAVAQALPSVRDGVFTAAQVEQGGSVYAGQCLSCHGELSAFVPEVAALLADHTFRNRWTGRSLGELFELIRDEMPQDAPGTLSAEQTADLVAYILSGNRMPAGDTPLTGDLERLSQIPFEP
jgi:mono/diheme cytochrome c family protein